MDFNYVRRFCAYVSTFYHSKYITKVLFKFIFFGNLFTYLFM